MTSESIEKYRKMYPNDGIGFEISGGVSVERESDGAGFRGDENESDEVFLDRLERSKKAGRNLFYEEWEPFEYEDGVDY